MKVKHYRKGNAYHGVIELRLDTPAKLVVVTRASDLPGALANAAIIAERLASDPVVDAMLVDSPEDIANVRELAQAAQDGPAELRAFMLEMGGELGAHGKRLGNKLKRHKEITGGRKAGGRHGDAPADDDQGDDNGDGNGYPDNTPAPDGYQWVDAPRDPTSSVGDVSGFWDDVSNLASKVGSEAWKQAKAHRKELAMAAATAAFGPAGAPLAAKAMDLVTAAQAGHPEAKEAVKNVQQQAKAGNPKAKLMMGLIRTEVKATAKQADATPAPDAAPIERDHGDNTMVDQANDTAPLDVDRDHGDGLDMAAHDGGE